MEEYRVINKIGSGSYGDAVWRAFNEYTNEVVAIKKLNMNYESVDEVRNLREVKALLKMKHPNIIHLKQIIKENGTVYMVFECMECNLYERMITRKSSFSEDEIRNMCFQIFEGLAFMHAKGYFHRDLKPENLLVSGNVVKIADLGLARETNGKPPYTDGVGTLWYCAPELLLYSPLYNSAIDMWAMGAIMAELFSGKPLFPGDSAGDQLFTICSVIGSPPESIWRAEGFHHAGNVRYRFPQLPGVQLSSLLPSASPEALNLIATLLSWSPCERPTAMEVLQHPFFYTCNGINPPPLIGEPIPLVLKMAEEREFERDDDQMKRLSLMETTSTKSSTTDSYNGRPVASSPR